MLGGKKDNNGRSGTIIPASTSHGLNSIVQGTALTGDINAGNDIRIDGTIKGNLTCKSKVIVGPTGVIEGDVHCQNAVVEGKFKGNLTVRELLHVKESASMEGKIYTGKIIVQSGAVFNVSCQMGADSLPKSNSQAREIVKESATA
ncbi:MAG: polymer-forming cytoskeletal protein [Saprospiraceae bacterium]|nr:polymer-forming cytoskeletal protein [Saprospiraceae bacterium]